MRSWWPVALLAAACGRIGFAPTTDPLGDGAGTGAGDGFIRLDALGTGIDGATDRPNVAFVTSTTTNGAMGGVAGADAMCMTAAANASLPGTFIAFLGSQAQAASDRLVGSRGWIRTGDGAPVADTAASLMAGAIFNALDRDEHGNKLSSPQYVWAGSTTVGGSVTNCSEWTGTSLWGNYGLLGGAMPEMIRPWDVYIFGCSGQASLYCFETGHAVPITPAVSSGLRVAFIATPAMHGGGVGALDTQCGNEATAAGLTGTFLAAVATQGNSIASRFNAGAGWARRDGTAISNTSASLFDGSDPLSFVNQLADGSYITAPGLVRTGGLPMVNGASNATCNSWTSTGNANADAGAKTTVGNRMWSYVSFPCGQPAYTLCLQN